MDSPGFKGLSLFVFLVIVYLANWVDTLGGIFNGSLVWPRVSWSAGRN